MRAVTVLLISILLGLALAACGEPAGKPEEEPSEAPDAVAEEGGQTPSSTAAEGGAQVVVDGSGFSVDEYGNAGYGLVLHNTSTAEDAYDLAITANLLDSAGNVIDTDNTTLSLLPAGETFYFGGEFYDVKKAKKLEAFVDIGTTEPAQYELPKATNVRLAGDQDFGLRVKGQVKNTHEGTLSEFARIGVVVFDKNDEVIGGGYAFLDANLPSGRTAAFDTGNGVSATPRSKAARVKASVENSFVQDE